MDKQQALNLVTENWQSYFKLPDDLQRDEEIVNITIRATDLFPDDVRFFHHTIWRDDIKIEEINLIEFDNFFDLLESATDNYLDNLNFPDSNIPPHLMDQADVFYRYNLNTEIDDFDDGFKDEVGVEDADDIRDRLEAVLDHLMMKDIEESLAQQRIDSYISLNPSKPVNNHRQILAACLIHPDNLFLAPKEFFTEENLVKIFEENSKALNTTPIQTWWYADIDNLLKHINTFLPLSNIATNAPLIQIWLKDSKNKTALGKIIELPDQEQNTDHLNEIPFEDMSEAAVIEHLLKKPFDFKKLPLESQNTRSIALAAVQAHGHLLNNCNEEFKSDKEFILAAVKYNGSCIQYAQTDLQSDREFIKECITIDGYSFPHISNNNYWGDKELALLAIENYWSAHDIIAKLSEELKGDKEIILKGVDKDHTCLSYATEVLQNDRNFVLDCMKINGCSFAGVKNETFKNDKEIVLTALDNLREDIISWSSYANAIISNISEELRSDKQIVSKALGANPYTISYFPTIQFSKEQILEFVKNKPRCYFQLTNEFKNDLDIINQLIESDATVYPNLSKEFLENKNIAIKAIQSYPLNYIWLTEKLKADDEILDYILNNPILRQTPPNN